VQCSIETVPTLPIKVASTRCACGRNHGAPPGTYASPEPDEYSDDYFGPGDQYELRGVEDDFNPPRQTERGYVGGVVWREPDILPTARPTDSGHYGELGHG
jgi:hypothetical protein